ncbi:MAG: LCP family protein [bacterium]|nr:LCP family protein [bacterium]
MALSRREASRSKRLGRLIAFCVLGSLLGAPGGIWLARQWLEASFPLTPLTSFHSPGPVPTGTPPTGTPPDPGHRAYNLLLLASDATGPRGRRSLDANTDTILLVKVDEGSRCLEAMAIPRDTRVPIEGHGQFKINAANAYEGADLACETVARLLEVPVHRHVLVSLQVVRDVVDALGGVEVTVPRRMRYRDRTGGLMIDLRRGRQHMDGATVEGFLRFRHDAQGDIGRVQRMRDFVEEVLPQLATPATLLKVGDVWQAIHSHIDTDLSATDVLRLARWLAQLDERPRLEMLPGTDRQIDGLWYWVPARGRARQLARALFVQEERDPAGPVEAASGVETSPE